MIYAARTVASRGRGRSSLGHEAVFLRGVSVPGRAPRLPPRLPDHAGHLRRARRCAARRGRRLRLEHVRRAGRARVVPRSARAVRAARREPRRGAEGRLAPAGEDDGGAADRARRRVACSSSARSPATRSSRSAPIPARVRVFANTIDVERLRGARRRPARAQRSSFGQRLGLRAGRGRRRHRRAPRRRRRASTRSCARSESAGTPCRRRRQRARARSRRSRGLGAQRDRSRASCPHEPRRRGIRGGDVFALLSLHEPWGVVVNEAAACRAAARPLGPRRRCRRPARATARTGSLVPAGDVDAAAEALRRLSSIRSCAARYGARSRELVAAWGYEPSVDALVDACREAIASR